ncbi:DegQ family serine endoprotease [Spiribacter roseus]|uniref:DegQ family serine endoprotease n=1 Tax=Spiribacter roseus TaxID=1855875 RepID=UPI00296ED1A5
MTLLRSISRGTRRGAMALMAVTMLLAPGVGAQNLPDFTDMVRENSPAVVNISTTQAQPEGRARMPDVPGMPDPEDLPEGHPFRDFMDRFMDDEGPEQAPPRRDARSLGSGFIISEDGYILTNNHVVEDASEIIVRLNDRRQMTAELVGADDRADLALLKVDGEDMPTVETGQSSEVEVGEWVLAIGAPFGFEYSVTAGIISAKQRSLPMENYIPFLQTDVAINPGNSGGPLFNLDGEVIGVNSHIYSRSGGFQGISFAIPIELAMDVADQLRDGGEVSRAWLGVVIQDVTRDLAESFGMDRPEGALIAQVLPDSPAAAAGIEPGDVVLEFDGNDVATSGALPPIVGQATVGSTVPVVVMRDGERQTLEVTLAELPDDAGQRGGGSPQTEPGAFEELGLMLQPLTAERRDALGLEPDVDGLVVAGVDGGPAAEAGIEPGDVIARVNRSPVEGVEAFREIIAGMESGRRVPLLVLRDGSQRFLALRIP